MSNKKSIAILSFATLCAGLHAVDPMKESSTRLPSCYQGEALSEKCNNYSTGYNPAAEVNLQSSWSGYFDPSFIYWYTGGLGTGFAESVLLKGGSSCTTGGIMLPPKSTVFTTSLYEYKPGFKVGLGATYRGEWTIASEYTYLRSTEKVSKAAPENTSTIVGQGVWTVDNWFQQTSCNGNSLVGSYLAASWHLGFDLVDLDLKRPYYLSDMIAVSPILDYGQHGFGRK